MYKGNGYCIKYATQFIRLAKEERYFLNQNKDWILCESNNQIANVMRKMAYQFPYLTVSNPSFACSYTYVWNTEVDINREEVICFRGLYSACNIYFLIVK